MHTLLSDGALLPSEMVRRAQVKGCRAVALTDHVDASNVEFVVPRIALVAKELRGSVSIDVVPGAEVTHVPPSQIGSIAEEARRLGAAIVVVHGESPVEPVVEGTNRAAIEAGVDILAHPGLISEEDVRLAAEAGVALEITSRKGHSLTNGHVARLAIACGAMLVINTDSHAPGDLIDLEFARTVLLGAGVPHDMLQSVFGNSESILQNARGR